MKLIVDLKNKQVIDAKPVPGEVRNEVLKYLGSIKKKVMVEYSENIGYIEVDDKTLNATEKQKIKDIIGVK